MSLEFPPTDDDALIAAGRRAMRELPDAPEWMILRAEALFSPRTAKAPSLLSRIQALLTIDSWANPVPALRGVAGTRQLLFRAGEHDIDLRLVPADGAWTIEGQLLGPEAVATTQLAGPGGQVVRVTSIDDLGSFRFDGLDAGRYQLELHFNDAVVELQPLEIGAAGPGG